MNCATCSLTLSRLVPLPRVHPMDASPDRKRSGPNHAYSWRNMANLWRDSTGWGWMSLFILIMAEAAGAQEVIRATNYSGFMGGDGYGWPLHAPAHPGRLEVALNGERVTLSWDSGSLLQSATEVSGPWDDVHGALSPHLVLVADSQQFYRLRQSDWSAFGVSAAGF